MNPDLQRKCARCGTDFWYTAVEQEYFQSRDLPAPDYCHACRGTNHKRPTASLTPVIPRAGELDSISVRSITVPSPLAVFGNEAFFTDIKLLLDDVRTPIVHRRRTFWEFIRRVDVIEKQRQDKSHKSQLAIEAMRERTEVLETAGQLTSAAALTQLASSRSIVEQLEVDTRGMLLLNQLQAERVIGPMKLQTKALEEQVKQHRLEAQLRESGRDEEERVLHRDRRNRLAGLRARQAKLDDFLAEIEAICDSKKPVSEKALRIREVQAAFEMDEDSLSAEARTILEKAEGRDDE